MNGELVKTITKDGLELDGFYACPPDPKATLVHIHGSEGNFYEHYFVNEIAKKIYQSGYAFLTVNTRGHGTFSSLKKLTDGKFEWKDIGAARELFNESPLDIQAWLEFLRQKNSKNIFLQGHSLGCNKIVYYYDLYDHPKDIKGLILLSPSDWIGYQVVYYADRYEADKKLARDMVERGKGDELMPLECFVYPISAQAYDVNLGCDTKTDMFNYFDDKFEFKLINAIPIPLLVTFGNDNEVVVRDPQECLNILQRHSTNPNFNGYVIDGSPHNYYRFENKLASIIDKWIKKVLSSCS